MRAKGFYFWELSHAPATSHSISRCTEWTLTSSNRWHYVTTRVWNELAASQISENLKIHNKTFPLNLTRECLPIVAVPFMQITGVARDMHKVTVVVVSTIGLQLKKNFFLCSAIFVASTSAHSVPTSTDWSVTNAFWHSQDIRHEYVTSHHRKSLNAVCLLMLGNTHQTGT